jgi:hypothetical protein
VVVTVRLATQEQLLVVTVVPAVAEVAQVILVVQVTPHQLHHLRVTMADRLLDRI